MNQIIKEAKDMQFTRLIIIVTATLFLCNFLLLLLVQTAVASIFLSVAVSITEVIALMIAVRYGDMHYHIIKKKMKSFR
jgi:hypothetical protein